MQGTQTQTSKKNASVQDNGRDGAALRSWLRKLRNQMPKNGNGKLDASQSETPVLIIQPSKGWVSLKLRELWEYRDLLYFLILRDIKSLYKQTVLGFSWAIIRPLFSMVVFSIVFGGLANVPSDGIPYPVFSYTALVPWTYFSSALNKSTQSLIGSAGIFTKVYFPRIIIPITPILAGLVDFVIALSIVFALLAWYGIAPTWSMAYLPMLVLLMILISAGMGMWLSALAIQYRDMRHAVQFLSQILMYAAPVVWPVSLIAEKFGTSARIIYGFYPMAGVIEGFRSSLLGHNPMPWDLIGAGTVSSIIVFIAGLLYFKRKERIFADVA